MSIASGISNDDLPNSPHARQLRAGFPWLTFDAELEREFRLRNFDESVLYTRVNLCLAILITIAFSTMDALVLGPDLDRIPSRIYIMVIIPALLIGLASSFAPQRHKIHAPLTIVTMTLFGLSVAAIQIVASLGGISMLTPSLILSIVFIYFMSGLIFYLAVAVNGIILLAYLAAGAALVLPGREFSYSALAIVAANLFCASVTYMHEKTSRLRFLEACLLREMVARDGLTGIQNRRMFDQHIARVWQQAVREEERVAVLLADIDCFKDYNDRYGHQAGDECLRAVAVSLSQCARRPLDFVARYGGEEFAIVLYEASREYVAEVLTRIQRSIAELNIPHEASKVASRLTLSIGAAFVLPAANRTLEGLIQLADEALYCAKEEGRNRVIVMEAEYHTMRTGRFEKRRHHADA
ncbi:MAG TPA: diguanylate cyclase [Steroidobacteraceae bacterium]